MNFNRTTTMDIINACEILNISQKHTIDQLKKAYYKMALRWHPDKPNGDTEMFKKIKAAYEFLKNNRVRFDSSPEYNDGNEKNDSDIKYTDILKEFISYLSPDTKWDNLFFETSFSEFTKRSAIQMGEKISLKIFKSLDLKRSIEMFEIIHKWRHLFNINDELFKSIEVELKEKMNSNNIIIINPTIDDLLNDNIYKYDFNDDVIYIPLWHKKMYHKVGENMILFLITPDLNNICNSSNLTSENLYNLENIEIKDNNDIHVKIKIKLLTLFEKGCINFVLGEKIYKIDSNQLLINKKPQMIIYKNKGLLKINKKNLYCTENRASIYIEVNLY